MKNLLKSAAGLLSYKKELSALLLSLEPEDVEKGRLIIHEALLSEDFKPRILSMAQGTLEDYRIKFSKDLIQISGKINARQLGPLTLEYQVKIQELRFDSSGHKIYATFTENAISNGNMAQKLAVKAALLNGPLLKTGSQILRKSFLHVDGNNIYADLDDFSFTKQLPETLRVGYLQARDGKLILSVHL